MPLYISSASIVAAYGEDFLSRMADHNDDQDTDDDSVSRAIRSAESEVNSYVGVLYPLPLSGITDQDTPEDNSSVPQALVQPCVDIAVYRLASEHDELTKERRKRYDDAVSWLVKLSKGDVKLGIDDTAAQVLSSDASYHGPPRIFTRDDTDGLV